MYTSVSLPFYVVLYNRFSGVAVVSVFLTFIYYYFLKNAGNLDVYYEVWKLTQLYIIYIPRTKKGNNK